MVGEHKDRLTRFGFRSTDNRHSMHRLDRMTNKRNRRIDHELHVASKRIIVLLVREGIGTLVIGKNDGWKQ